MPREMPRGVASHLGDTNVNKGAQPSGVPQPVPPPNAHESKKNYTHTHTHTHKVPKKNTSHTHKPHCLGSGPSQKSPVEHARPERGGRCVARAHRAHTAGDSICSSTTSPGNTCRSPTPVTRPAVTLPPGGGAGWGGGGLVPAPLHPGQPNLMAPCAGAHPVG